MNIRIFYRKRENPTDRWDEATTYWGANVPTIEELTRWIIDIRRAYVVKITLEDTNQ